MWYSARPVICSPRTPGGVGWSPQIVPELCGLGGPYRSTIRPAGSEGFGRDVLPEAGATQVVRAMARRRLETA
ncbi:hypothetical protein [Streptomyces sp. NPDC021212]|uniref:hypothetical protein n=1 Tax=Streptomyces sp. NPDC021212 TaxID=3365118 RepID=UPI00378A8439